MSIANAYPPSSTLPYGARSIQNVPLVTELGQSTTLAELLRGPSRFLLIVFEADSDSAEHETRWLAQLSSAAQRVPLRTFVCRQHAIPNSRLEQIIDAQGLLLLQARAQPGDCIVIRPDAYLALRLAPDECTELSERLRGLLFGQGSLPSH
jgi:3-(3-hydroxy-phenyl)propionate hydroxylase